MLLAAMRGGIYAVVIAGVLLARMLKARLFHLPAEGSALAFLVDVFTVVLMVEAAFWVTTRWYGRAWKRLRSSHRELTRFQALFALSEALAHESDVTNLYYRIVHHLHDLFHYPHVRMYEIRGEEQILRAFIGLPPVAEQQRLRPGAIGYLRIPPAASHEYIPDISRYASPYRWLDKGARITLPLWVGEKCVALLMIAHPQVNAFENDLTTLEMVENLLNAALGRICALQKSRQRANELLALQDTMRDILAETELDALLRAILQRAIDLLSAEGGDLGLFEAHSGETRVVATLGLTRDYTGVRLQLGEGAMGWVEQHRQALFVRDYNAWHNRSAQYTTLVKGTQVLAAPLETKDTFIGAIAIIGQDFRERDLELLELFAQQASLAVENARLYHHARLSAEKRRVLYEASRDIVAALSPEKICAAVHQAAARVMPAEAFTITMVNAHTQQFEALYAVDRGQRFRPPPFPLTDGLSGRMLERQKPLRIDNMLSFEQGDTVPVQHFGLPERVKSVLAVPVRIQGKVAGMLSAQSYEPYAYTEEDEQLLSTLANHAAIALENARLFARVRDMAMRDELTGAFNRRYLFRRATYELARAQRYQRPLGVIMFDADHFKRVNDTYGHAAGDQVLQSIVCLCMRHLRKSDILGRYGGEEFVILLPETDLETTRYVAERLRVQLEERPVMTDSGPVAVTISVGVTGYLPSDETLKTLFRRADMALYQAKNGGRNRVCLVMTDDTRQA